MPSGNLIIGIVCGIAAGVAFPLHCRAGDPVSADSIEKALEADSQPLTRGINVRRESPSIALAVNFEVNSATLMSDAVDQLRSLADALKRASLAANAFIITGHTDASGRAAYNKALSQRRASAVRDFLVGAGIDASRLAVCGMGEERLKNREEPESAENRRVEITKLYSREATGYQCR